MMHGAGYEYACTITPGMRNACTITPGISMRAQSRRVSVCLHHHAGYEYACAIASGVSMRAP